MRPSTPQHSPSSAAKRWLPRIAALVVGLCIALALAELAARKLRPDLGTIGRAYSGVGWATPEYADFDPLATPPDGLMRVLALGDSFLGPAYYEDGTDTRFPAVLETRMEGRVHCQTLATPGWGTDQQLLAYLEKGRPWKPNLVVLAFCSNNDLTNILSCSHGRTSKKPYFVLEQGALRLYSHLGEPLRFEPSERVGWRVRSRFVDWIRYEWVMRQTGDVPDANGKVDPRYTLYDGLEHALEPAFYQLADRLETAPHLGPNLVNAYTVEPNEWNSYQWELLGALLASFRDEVQKDGGEFLLLFLPMTLLPSDARFVTGSGLVHTYQTPRGAFTIDMAFPASRLAEICKAHGIAFLDPTAEFQRRLAEPGMLAQFWPREDRHWSALAQEFLARQLVPLVIERLRARGQ